MEQWSRVVAIGTSAAGRSAADSPRCACRTSCDPHDELAELAAGEVGQRLRHLIEAVRPLDRRDELAGGEISGETIEGSAVCVATTARRTSRPPRRDRRRIRASRRIDHRSRRPRSARAGRPPDGRRCGCRRAGERLARSRVDPPSRLHRGCARMLSGAGPSRRDHARAALGRDLHHEGADASRRTSNEHPLASGRGDRIDGCECRRPGQRRCRPRRQDRHLRESGRRRPRP